MLPSKSFSDDADATHGAGTPPSEATRDHCDCCGCDSDEANRRAIERGRQSPDLRMSRDQAGSRGAEVNSPFEFAVESTE